MLRLLSSRGVFRLVDGQRVALTAPAQFLRSDHPMSLRDMLSPLPEFLLAWSRAVDAVRTGKNGWELARGTGMFPFLADHPEAADHFNRKMFSRTRMHLRRILDGYDWGPSAGWSTSAAAAASSSPPSCRGIRTYAVSCSTSPAALPARRREPTPTSWSTSSTIGTTTPPPASSATVVRRCPTKPAC
jgi:hypothetical protein